MPQQFAQNAKQIRVSLLQNNKKGRREGALFFVCMTLNFSRAA
jgi:hypothetical protein